MSIRAFPALLLGLLLGGLVTPAIVHAQVTDTDADGLPDAWESQFGLNPGSAAGDDGAAGDPDADGLTNAQELAAGSHPVGRSSRLFAEGATGSFFDTRFALFNPDGIATARVLIRFFTSAGTTVP